MNEFVILATAVLTTIIILIIWAAKRRQAALLATVEVVALPNFASAHLQNSRQITVFLPPDYHLAVNRRYPTLYVNDGQDKEALRLHETVAQLTGFENLSGFLAWFKRREITFTIFTTWATTRVRPYRRRFVGAWPCARPEFVKIDHFILNHAGFFILAEI